MRALIVLLAAPLWAATITVTDSSQLQGALNSAACGDTIAVAPALYSGNWTMNAGNVNCTDGNEIVLTNTLADWLPDPDMRPTLAYKALMPILQTETYTLPALQIGVSGTPAKGLKVIGIGFRNNAATGQNTYYLVQVGNPSPANAGAECDNITLDRIWMSGSYSTQSGLKQAVEQECKRFWYINSFAVELKIRGQEGHGVTSVNGLGPFVYRNLYISGTSSGIFYGGAAPSFNGAIADGMVAEHNILTVPDKLYPDSPDFIYTDTYPYCGNACAPVVKNLMETKGAKNVTWRWNRLDNSRCYLAGGGTCYGAQYFGVTITARVNTTWQVNGEYNGTATLGGDPTVVTVSSYLHGVNPSGWYIGQAVGLATSGSPGRAGFEYHTITAVLGGNSFQVDAPYTNAYVTTNCPGGCAYQHVPEPWSINQNILVEHNYFTECAGELFFGGRDDNMLGATQNVRLRNNLNTLSNSNLTRLAPRLATGATRGGDLTLEHGTTLVGSGVTVSSIMTFDPPQTTITYVNNTDAAGNYGLYSSGKVPGSASFQNFSTSGSVYRYSTFDGATAASYTNCTTGYLCDHNLFHSVPAGRRSATTFRGETSGDFAVTGPSDILHAGSDGRTLGADARDISAVQYMQVTPLATALLYQWRLPAHLAGMGCTLEVSADRALYYETAEFAVVAAVDPTLNRRADADRHNPRATVSGDGTVRSFLVDGLAAGTTYYHRLMCGGALARGQASTLSGGNTGATTLSVATYAGAGYSQVRARYGTRAGSLTTGDWVACDSGCTVSVPAARGDQLVYYIDQSDGVTSKLSNAPAVVAVR